MNKRIRILFAVITVLMLLAVISLPVFAARTQVTEVVATSNIDELAALYGRTKKVEYSLTEGEPVKFNQSWECNWEKYNEGSDIWENYEGRFYPGKYRAFVQLRVDGSDAVNYELSKSLTFTVDGKAWTLDTVSQHPEYSCVFAYSPEIVIADDPSVTEPQDVENAYFMLNGYVPGQKASDIELYPYLGTENKLVIVGDPMFFNMIDADYNGTPDAMESGTPPSPDELIAADAPYMVILSLRATEGYDIFGLEYDNINMPCTVKNNMYKMVSGYNEETEIYQVFLGLVGMPKVEFTESPSVAVGYYNDVDGEKEGNIEITWATDKEVDEYQISRFDEEEQEWCLYTGSEDPCFNFSYNGEAESPLFRIEAVKHSQTVAVSEPFRITWKEKKAVTLPIRIDVSPAAGSKTPVDLTEYYPESDQYEFITDEGFNCFIDDETDEAVTQFVNGKKYSYAIGITVKEGYYIESDLLFGIPDTIRLYGIGWDKIENVGLGGQDERIAIFSFTYNGETGIPAEKDKLLNELVFDGSSLVGVTTPAKLPNEIFNHAALTVCDENCGCTTIDESLKQMINFWEQRELNADPIPATAFLQGKGYIYMLAFHVADGWSVPGVLNTFDFVLSGTGLEVIDVAYQAEMKVLGVRLAFMCEDTNGIPAGEHTCMLNKVDAVAATCTENGNILHYSCSCGKKYSDKWKIHEIIDVSAAATGHSLNKSGDQCTVCKMKLGSGDDDGLGAGAIVGIVIGSVAVVGVGGFALFWFVIKKKSFADLLGYLKK